MKRVLFHYPVLNTGGAEMSTLRMIKALADRGWEVTLVLTTGGGSLEPMIDPRVRIVRLRPCAFGSRFARASGLAARLRAFPDLAGYLVMRAIGALRRLPFLFRRYDAAAVLLMGTPSDFVRKCVRARVRAIWIRNDLTGADPCGRVATNLQAAAPGIDHFICVSEIARRSLIAAVPAAAGKDVVIYNILDPKSMQERVFEGVAPSAMSEAGVLRILSVCRLSEQAKGLLRMVRVCRRLLDAGLVFHWYIAGDGPDRSILEAEIAHANIGANMTLLGRLDNPFPAYRIADVVAMLSNYEGLCGVVNEARVLEKTIIATQVSGIDEQLTDGVNGLVVAQDDDSIVAGMTRLLTDTKLRERLAKGGYPEALLNDTAKLDRIEALFLGGGIR